MRPEELNLEETTPIIEVDENAQDNVVIEDEGFEIDDLQGMGDEKDIDVEEETVIEAVEEVKEHTVTEERAKSESKGTLKFANAIKAYCDGRAAGDELFAKTYAKPNKNIEDCVTYILNTVKASGQQGFMDEEIYSMAVHYYDEDDIKVGSKLNCQVITNQSQVFEGEELAQLKEKAKEQVLEEVRSGMGVKKARAKSTPTVKKDEVQQSLF